MSKSATLSEEELAREREKYQAAIKAMKEYVGHDLASYATQAVLRELSSN